MKRSNVYGLIIVTLIVLLAFAFASLANAQGTLTLEGLAARVDALLGRVDTHEQRLAAIETAIAPTPTPKPSSTPVPTATATHTPTPENRASLTIRRRMNVRRGPGTNYEIIGTAGTGDAFEIVGKNLSQDWWQIEYEGDAGWVYAPYVTAIYAGDVEIVATPTVVPTATARATSTPVPTATALPASGNNSEAAVTAAALLGVDYMNDLRAWENLSQVEKHGLAIFYTGYMEFAADHCDLSYEDMAFLVDSYADVLDEAGFTSPEGVKPRGWLLSFLWGFAKDGIEDLEAAGVDCDWILEAGIFSALGQ